MPPYSLPILKGQRQKFIKLSTLNNSNSNKKNSGHLKANSNQKSYKITEQSKKEKMCLKKVKKNEENIHNIK
jgi:hypothetical protein